MILNRDIRADDSFGESSHAQPGAAIGNKRDRFLPPFEFIRNRQRRCPESTVERPIFYTPDGHFQTYWSLV